MNEMAYSLHLGSDKNRKNISKETAKNNISGTTSLSNNAIQNAKALSRVDKHNYRKYDNNQELIKVIKGTTSLYNDVINLYKTEFEEARLEYNSRQTRDDRKINNYFKKISDNSKNDLACEIIIELGDKKYWDTKDNNFKYKMTNVFTEQVNDLENLLPNFKIASAIIHYDETSPHLHIVGVPIKYKNKNGMSKQVGKADVFTKEILKDLQDNMRTLCMASFNKEYGLNNILKAKQKGRNSDINVKDMDNYQIMKEELENKQKDLEKANKKSLELDMYSNDIKDTVYNLKKTPIVKNTYTISEVDKNKIINYIDKVDKTNEEYKKIQMLSITLNNVDNELKDNREKIKVLTENNNALDIKVSTLEKNIEDKDKQLDKLKEENFNLKITINYFQNLFNKLVKFIKKKLFKKIEDRENYMDFSKELYEHGIFDENTIKDIKSEYMIAIDNSNKKQRDDLER